jgi:pimeloyl-ACP methyl ester carboxylesterase
MDGLITILRGGDGEPVLQMRRQRGNGPPILYVHGATFPSALSVAYRFEGRSWMDDLAAHGSDAWAFDFAGFGGSDRYAEMNDANAGMPLGRATEAAAQIARVVEHIAAVTGYARIAIIAHSWGTIVAGLYATRHPERIDKLCFFGPVVRREIATMVDPRLLGRWRLLTVADQWTRFVEDVPRNHSPVLIEPQLEQWGQAYLATDREAATRSPPAVKIPNGPIADINAAWSGELAYRPEDIGAPLLVVRGEWDSLSTDKDADWLLSHIGSSVRKDAKIPKGTHLLHLERSREELFAAVRTFLEEET